MIPTALIERIDIITGGASAVYGSDAISGAVNVILKDDFEGVDVRLHFADDWQGRQRHQHVRLHRRFERRRWPWQRVCLAYRGRSATVRARRSVARSLGITTSTVRAITNGRTRSRPRLRSRVARLRMLSRPELVRARRCRRASPSRATRRASASSATTARSAELLVVQLQPLQLVPDSAEKWGASRSPTSRSTTRMPRCIQTDLLQHAGGPADRPVGRLRPAVLDPAREPVPRRARPRRG